MKSPFFQYTGGGGENQETQTGLPVSTIHYDAIVPQKWRHFDAKLMLLNNLYIVIIRIIMYIITGGINNRKELSTMKIHTSLRIGQIMMARIKRLSALEEKSQHMIIIQCLEKGLNYYEKPYIRKAKENRQEATSGDQASGEKPKDQIEQLRSAHVARLERDSREGLDLLDDEENKRLQEEIEIAKAPWVNQDE